MYTPQFNAEYNPTKIGQFKKDTQTDRGDKCTIEILDTAGEEDFLVNVSQYYAAGDGFMFVFAINDIDSLYRIKEMYEDVAHAKGESRVDMILVGNKSDLEFGRQVLTVEGQSLADRWKCEYIETSAKTGDFVSDAFQAILGLVQDSKFKVASPEVKKTKKKRKFLLKAKCSVI